MVTVVHTGDTHLGYHQYHKPQRERDFMDAFVQTVDEAIERDADAYVHAGDLFEDPQPSPAVQEEVLQNLNRLDDAGIKFLAVVGNHDRATRGQWLDLFEEAGCGTHIGRQPVVIDDVAFYGMDYMGQARRKQFDYNFPTTDADHSVLVAHGQFAPITPGDWDLEGVLTRSSVDFDAVLLGDEHDRVETTVSGVPVTYAGSTERTATDQGKPRTYNTVTFDDDIEIDKYELDTRPFEVFEVELEEGDGFESVRAEIDDRDLEGAVVRVDIDGEGERISGATVEEYAEDEADAFYAIVKDKREFDEEVESIDVDFTDPEEAIEDRVGDIRLSSTLRDLERVVRDDSVAKSNLKQRSADEIEEALETEPDTLKRPESPTGEGSEDGEKSEQDAAGTEGVESEGESENTSDTGNSDDGRTDGGSTKDEDDGLGTASLTDFE